VGREPAAIQAAIEKQIKYFVQLDERLIDVAFDCLMAISKVCQCLQFFYMKEKKATAVNALQASKLQKDINDLKDQQDLLVEFVD
jgi:hypothetical protein